MDFLHIYFVTAVQKILLQTAPVAALSRAAVSLQCSFCDHPSPQPHRAVKGAGHWSAHSARDAEGNQGNPGALRADAALLLLGKEPVQGGSGSHSVNLGDPHGTGFLWIGVCSQAVG